MKKIAIIGAGPVGIVLAKILVQKGYKPDLIEAGDWETEATLTLGDYTFKSCHKVPPGVRLVGGQSTKWFGRVSLFPMSAYVNRSGINGHDWSIPYSRIENSYKEICKILEVDDQTDKESVVHQCQKCETLVDRVFFDFLKVPNMFVGILNDMLQKQEVNLLTSSYCSELLDTADGVETHIISTVNGLSKNEKRLYSHVFICCGTLDSTRLILNSFPEFSGNTAVGKFLMDHLDGYVGEVKIGPRDYQCLKNFRLEGDRRLSGEIFGLGITKFEEDINWHLEICPLVRVYLFDPGTKRFPKIPIFFYRTLFLLERASTFIPNRLSRFLMILTGVKVFSLWLRAEEFPNSKSTLSLRELAPESDIPNLVYQHKVSQRTKKTIQLSLLRFVVSIKAGKIGRIKLYWWLSLPGIFNLGGNNHPMGTLSMGSSQFFPVNAELKLKRDPRISVVSGAVFPSGSHQNPTSLAMCLAYIATDSIPDNK